MNTTTQAAEQPDLFDLLRSRPEPVEASTPVEVDEEMVLTDDAEAVEADDGQKLLPEARRAFVSLLRYGVIMAENKRVLFDALCRYHKPIQARLDDMLLRMILDEQAGIALLLQKEIDDNDDESSALISRRTLSVFDTLLLLVLRKHYQERNTEGEQKVIIDIERIEIALRPFLPLTNSSRADRRNLSGALKTMKDRRILSAVRGEDDRFEITPVIRYVVNADFLEQMLSEYEKLAQQAGIKMDMESIDG